MCRFDMPYSRTNSIRGVKTVRIKNTQAEKKGFTVALAASADGTKLPAVIVSRNVEVFLDKELCDPSQFPRML